MNYEKKTYRRDGLTFLLCLEYLVLCIALMIEKTCELGSTGVAIT